MSSIRDDEIPESTVLIVQPGAVVIVAHIFRHNAWVRLAGKRRQNVREGFIRPPGDSVVGGLARKHLIAPNGGATLDTGLGGIALVIPHREKAAVRSGREVGLPLSLGRGIGVQLQWRAKGNATIHGADVEDISGIAVARVARVIDVVNDAAHGRRLSPALVPPVATLGTCKHACEEAVRACGTTRRREGGAGVGIGPGVAAISGLVDLVGPVGQTSAHLVHAGNVKGARGRVAGDLDIADEWAGGGQLTLAVPSRSVVGREADSKATSICEIIPSNIHPAKEGTARVVVRPARLAVVAAASVDAEMSPARGIRGSGGFVPAKSLTTAGDIEPHREPGIGCAVVQTNGVTQRILEGALTVGRGKAGEGSAAVGGKRRAGDVDRVFVAASRVVVSDEYLVGVFWISRREGLRLGNIGRDLSSGNEVDVRAAKEWRQ